MRRLLHYLDGYRKEAILAPLFKMLEASFELFIPLVVAGIIDHGIMGNDIGYIWRMCAVMVALGVIGLVCSLTAQYFSAKAAMGFGTALRQDLFRHINTLSYTELDRIGTATLVTRITTDINQTQSGVNLMLRLFLRSPFIVAGAVIMSFTISVRIAIVFLTAVPLISLVIFLIMKATVPVYRNVQNELDHISLITRENHTGVRVIRAFRREQSESDRFARLNQLLIRAQLRAGRFTAALNPLTFVVLNLAVVLLLRSGALRVEAGSLTQGQVVALYNYMSQILVELVKLANLIVTLTKSAACASRVSDILAIHPEQKDGTRFLSPEDLRSLTFRDVSIAYNDSGDAALEHISFTAFPGQTVGIIGGTGSGKSTLVNLIPRFYDHTEGEILFGETPIQSLTISSLRSAIGVVPQRAMLFQGTIRSNLLWGNPEATDQDLWEALEIAQGAEIVRGKPLGLDEPVQQGGKNFSGGQRQRLTIARALVRRPAILILDDSASALDYATDAALRRALRGMKNPPLTLIVSQRTSSVRFADQILVLEDGLCVGRGTHEELLASCEVYREIHEASSGKEESANG